MSPKEFKTWFRGLCENVKGQPNEKQWERICEEIEALDAIEPSSRPIVIPGPQKYEPDWPLTPRGPWRNPITFTSGESDK